VLDNLSSLDIPLRLLNSDDPVAVVVGVHLHLEAFLIELINEKLVRPRALNLDRLNFPSKVGLAVALDAIPETAAPALRTINELRNRIAHNLNAQLVEADAERLRDQLSFIRALSALPSWDAAASSQRVALCAAVLQAWLSGMVEAQAYLRLHPGAGLEAEARRR
jgi:hypothetical protein